MPQFLDMLLGKVKYYINSARKSPSDTMDEFAALVRATSVKKLARYDSLEQMSLKVSMRINCSEELCGHIVRAIKVMEHNVPFEFPKLELTDILVDHWFSDEDGRYLDAGEELVRIHGLAASLIAEHEKLKKDRPTRAEYYRMRLDPILKDTTAILLAVQK